MVQGAHLDVQFRARSVDEGVLRNQTEGSWVVDFGYLQLRKEDRVKFIVVGLLGVASRPPSCDVFLWDASGRCSDALPTAKDETYLSCRQPP